MSSFAAIAILCGLILILLAARAIYVIRKEQNTTRGSEPGSGYHVIEANYHSGGMGGGQSSTFRVPKDPQEYAKAFVPRNRKTEK